MKYVMSRGSVDRRICVMFVLHVLEHVDVMSGVEGDVGGRGRHDAIRRRGVVRPSWRWHFFVVPKEIFFVFLGTRDSGVALWKLEVVFLQECNVVIRQVVKRRRPLEV